jgi:hypothetical protein
MKLEKPFTSRKPFWQIFPTFIMFKFDIETKEMMIKALKNIHTENIATGN